MAEKPRVKAPKQRQTHSTDASSRRRLLTIGVAIAGVALGFVVVAVALGFFGGTDTGEAALPGKFETAGCTFKEVPALEGAHSIGQPNGTSDKWNTGPPTNGAPVSRSSLPGCRPSVAGESGEVMAAVRDRGTP